MKSLSLNKIRIIQLFLIFLCASFYLFEIYLINPFCYFIPFISLVILFFSAYEFKYKNNYFRLIYLILIINFCIQFVHDIRYTNLFFLIFLLAYAIILIFTILFSSRYISVSKKEKGKLPLGMLSNKHNRIHKTIMGITYALLALLAYLDFFVFENALLFIGSILVLFIVLLIVLLKINPLIKLCFLVEKDFKYNEFMNKVKEIKNNNLNSETYNYLLLLEANYTAFVDKKESIRMFEHCNRPLNKQYEKFYEVVELCYLYNKNNKETFDIKYKIFKEKYPKNLNNKVFDIYFDLNDKDKEIKDIEKIFNINTKINFNKFGCSYSLMNYYYIRGNLNKAKKYAKIIIDLNANEFKEVYTNALHIYEQN